MMEGKVERFKSKPFLSLLKLEIEFSNRYCELLEKNEDSDEMESEELEKIIKSSHESLLKRIDIINNSIQSNKGTDNDEEPEDKD